MLGVIHVDVFGREASWQELYVCGKAGSLCVHIFQRIRWSDEASTPVAGCDRLRASCCSRTVAGVLRVACCRRVALLRSRTVTQTHSHTVT
eukprot:365893-Chlamydomonas_euryale.AAC.5